MRALILAPLAALAACATVPPEPQLPQGTAARGDPARAVPAALETVVTTNPRVDADDPALWADPRDPARAVIFATDKTDGLYVHDMDGRVRQFLRSGPLDNVDVRDGFRVGGKDYVLVAAMERKRFGIMTFLFDPDTLETRSYGFIPTDMGEPYGSCMGKRGGDFYVVANNKAGGIFQYRITAGPSGPVATLERRMKVATQPEGCVVDEKADTLYLGEEDVAIWRFDFDPRGSADPMQVAVADGIRLTADIEGLAILRDRGVDYLIASSQGDATFPVWRIEGANHVYVGRFAVEGGAIDAVTGTDGIDAWSGPIGPFPEGAIAMHDTADGDGPQQNFKVVDWRDVRRALGL
ncbi:MAG: phytase [Sphingomonas sp.]|nr:phytase [Sphingomonas sp.]MDX3885063.1 phytase [Sphingomonas sp.]